MILYSGTSQQFIQDTIQNQIAEKLKQAFFYHLRYNPSAGEVNSWRNSLKAICMIFQYANLLDHGVILEYQLPLSSLRMDCMICGKDDALIDNAIIIELKQWDKCKDADGENEVTTWVGGQLKEVLHPSVQVGRYKNYLEDVHTAFYEENPISLFACTYLHNYNYYSSDIIFSNKFEKCLNEYPLFTADDVEKLKGFLRDKLQKGNGIDVLKRIEQSKYRPSRKLMDHVGNVIRGVPSYTLLDEQQVVYDKVFSFAKEGFHDKQKIAMIIKGGPGTGKSVIAINLLADLLLKGYNAHYATGSRAFTQTLRKIIGTRGSIQFKYFNSYTDADSNVLDVLICDEAHRLRTSSNNRFTPKKNKSKEAQIDEIIRASKVSVFFIDDDQIVRPGEIGSVAYIKAAAEKNKCKLFEYELDIQFRCGGSDAFVNWINNTLGIKRTANVLWDIKEEFDFKIFNTPEALEAAIREKSGKGFTARMTAGFCWPWSMPDNEGKLENDVVIGEYKRPWNAKPEAKKLANNIPISNLWANDPNGINQIGCIYTAQGFEFDYVGVIIGNDLTYDFESQSWKGLPQNSADTIVKRSKDQFLQLTKNTYRVLLSRGMKGCYVYFIDKEAEKFFKTRLEA